MLDFFFNIFKVFTNLYSYFWCRSFEIQRKLHWKKYELYYFPENRYDEGETIFDTKRECHSESLLYHKCLYYNSITSIYLYSFCLTPVIVFDLISYCLFCLLLARFDVISGLGGWLSVHLYNITQSKTPFYLIFFPALFKSCGPFFVMLTANFDKHDP